jgi:hypothetical protein
MLDRLAVASGMSAIETIQDAFTCLCKLGLLGEDHDEHDDSLLAPNPAPRAVWDVLELPPQRASGLRIQGLAADYSTLEHDLRHLCRWSENGQLSSTARSVAVRLSLSVGDVLGTMKLLNERTKGTVTFETTDPAADTPFTMRGSAKR